MKKTYLFLFIALIIVLNTCSFALAEESQFVILHTNDIHGYLLPYQNKEVNPQPPYAVSGASYLAALIHQQAGKYKGKVLLVNAGDMFEGQYISNKFYGKSVVEVMNKAGYDACTLGNHEFHAWGVAHLRERLAEMRFPCVSSNVIDKKTGKPLANTVPYLIKEVNGLKLGILGLTVTSRIYYDSAITREVEFLSPVKAVHKYLPELKKQGVDLVIVLSHLGYDQDRMLARRVPEIDIIVGGHDHKVLHKPFIFKNRTIILQAGCYGNYLGELVVYFNKETKKIDLNKTTGRLIPVIDKNIKPDKEIEAVVQKYKKLAPEIDKVVGVTKIDLAGHRTGYLLTKAMKEYTKADIVLCHKELIRGDLYRGNITFGDAYMVMPFGLKVMKIGLNGMKLKVILKFISPKDLYTAGLKEGIKPNKIYQVATVDYHAVNTLIKLIGVKSKVSYDITYRDVFVSYLQQNSPISNKSFIIKE